MKKDMIYDKITNEIIKQLKQGKIPWDKPWIGGMAKNLISKKAYQGLNAIMLPLAGYSSDYWVTFNQARKLGGGVNAGEKGTMIVFWKIMKSVSKNAITLEDETNVFPLLKVHHVFNVEQCNGLEKHIPKESILEEFTPIEKAENIVKAYKDIPYVKTGTRASYSPFRDTITVPNKKKFKTPEEYYSTLFHEMGHSTGHTSRLDRKEVTGMNIHGDADYSFEELVAEFSAAFLCMDAGIKKTRTNSVAYIQHWIAKLEKDNKLIMRASSKAVKAVKYIKNEVNYKNIDKVA